MRYISTFGGHDAKIHEEIRSIATTEEYFDLIDKAVKDVDQEDIVEILEFLVECNKPKTGWRW